MTESEYVKMLINELITLATAVAEGNATGIHAIKAYRAATGSSLLVSKDWYDSLKATAPAMIKLEERVARLEKMAGL